MDEALLHRVLFYLDANEYLENGVFVTGADYFPASSGPRLRVGAFTPSHNLADAVQKALPTWRDKDPKKNPGWLVARANKSDRVNMRIAIQELMDDDCFNPTCCFQQREK
jgi:hypothetical protein